MKLLKPYPSGGPGRSEGFEAGFFARPTVLADVRSKMRSAREEIFSLVLVMIPFEDEAEAIRIASDYELAAYVQEWLSYWDSLKECLEKTHFLQEQRVNV